MKDDIFLTVAMHFPAGDTEVILAKEKEENRRWMGFSLQSAFRGMEDERELYADKDLKERFQ